MPLTRTYAFSTPTLNVRVLGITILINKKIDELRLKKDREQIYLRMIISDNPNGYPDLEARLRKDYEESGWDVSFVYSTEGTEIILR